MSHIFKAKRPLLRLIEGVILIMPFVTLPQMRLKTWPEPCFSQVTSVSLVRGIIILNQKEGTTDNGQTHLTSTSQIKLQLLIQHKCDTLITVYINMPGKSLTLTYHPPPESVI